MTDIADDACYRSLLVSQDGRQVCTHASFRLKPRPENMLMQYVRQSATATWLFAKTRQHGPELFSVSNAAATCDVGLHWISDDPPDLRLQVRHALSPLKDLHDSVVQSGGQLLVTTSPVLWQVLSADEAPELSRRYGIRGATPFASTFPFEVLSRFCEQSRIGMALYAREIARCLIEDPPSDWAD
jgi:predicted ATPase